jgi:hypothetical protein
MLLAFCSFQRKFNSLLIVVIVIFFVIDPFSQYLIQILHYNIL